MGCDIHACVEVRRTIEGVERWISADYYTPDPYDGGFDLVPVYNGRSYALFTALAGVRSGGHDVALIVPPRGVPEDISEHVRKEVEYWDCDGHNHSWVTLQELYDYREANPTTTHSGLISIDQARALDEGGTTPNSWCQGTTRSDFVRRSWTEDYCVADMLIDRLEMRAAKALWYYGDMPMPRDKADMVRLVFWFDN